MPKEDKKKKKKLKAGGVELTQEEFDVVAKGKGGMVTPAVKEAEANILQQRAAATPTLLSPAEQAKIEAPRIEAGKEFLEEKGVLEQKQPERVELDIEREGYPAKLPVIGATAQVVGGFISDAVLNKAAKDLGIESPVQAETLIQNPETRREIMLQAVQEEVIKEHTSTSEKFGAIIEAIPIVGGAIGKYAGELIETPSENVKTIVDDIQNLKETASSMREQAQTGKIDPFDAIDRIEEYEAQVAELEQRIRLLSLESAELIVNADALNLIETKILEVRRRLFNAKQAAAAGIVAPATDSNLYLTLKELKGL